MNYLFVPFTSEESNNELLSMGTLWASQVAKDPRGREPPKLLFYNTKHMKPLNIINNDDTLYVIAHGYEGISDYIFSLSTPPANGLIPALTAGELSVSKRSINPVLADGVVFRKQLALASSST
ncbi:hypothetical protein N1F29_23985, partial [Pseudomonas aeruginosa]|nr:hypothetical protein [Pseudomonas aeruginosa]MCS8258547.1 hypothetical protein [Pseudomonas aeruginosa]MCS8757057.1 hypothetical protein [Pseudomonas aeruginosa]